VNPEKLRDFNLLTDVTDGRIALQQSIFILGNQRCCFAPQAELMSATDQMGK
jgi:hypothetical protein